MRREENIYRDVIGVPQEDALENVLEGGAVEHRGLRVLCPTRGCLGDLSVRGDCRTRRPKLKDTCQFCQKTAPELTNLKNISYGKCRLAYVAGGFWYQMQTCSRHLVQKQRYEWLLDGMCVRDVFQVGQKKRFRNFETSREVSLELNEGFGCCCNNDMDTQSKGEVIINHTYGWETET